MIRIISYFSLVFILLLLVLCGFIYYAGFTPNSDNAVVVNVKIPMGSSFADIVKQLDENNLLRSRTNFKLVARIFNFDGKLKAGKYELSGNSSNYELLKILAEGKTASQSVTIPEGKTSNQIASILRAALEIDSTEFVSLVHDSTFINALEIKANSLEGYLYPDTYRLDWGISEKQIIRIMVQHFNELFVDSLRQRAKETGFSVNQILTLASIIEGEAILDSERVYISALYHNRLKRGIPLQADPTIQFIIPDGPRRLLNRDLEIDSPYNTYKYSGLPPGPINNPRIQSVVAALYPADVGYIYMVARGDGSHVFSYTLNQHLRAKHQFDKIRREVNRKKRREAAGGRS